MNDCVEMDKSRNLEKDGRWQYLDAVSESVCTSGGSSSLSDTTKGPSSCTNQTRAHPALLLLHLRPEQHIPIKILAIFHKIEYCVCHFMFRNSLPFLTFFLIFLYSGFC